MSEEIECEVQIRIEFKSKEVPSINEVFDAITVDDKLMPNAEYSIVKIIAKYELTQED